VAWMSRATILQNGQSLASSEALMGRAYRRVNPQRPVRVHGP
jgi:hypothetical protein